MTEPAATTTEEVVQTAVEEALVNLVDVHEEAQDFLVNNGINIVGQPMRGFTDWYSHAAIRELVNVMAPLLSGLEMQAARDADAHMASVLRETTGKRVRPEGIRNTQLGRQGVDRETTLGRIANAFRWQQSQVDRNFIDGVNSGKFLTGPGITPEGAADLRLNQIVRTNLQMASRDQFQRNLERNDLVTGYRRILHPELSVEGTCGLCIAASDRIYKKGTLLPIHPGCHCTVLPIVDGFDPGSINEFDFKTLYRDAGGSSTEQLRATRYKIDEHGEIGPVLRPFGLPILGPKKSAAREDHEPDQGNVLRRRRDELVGAMSRLRQRIESGEDQHDPENIAAIMEAQQKRIDELSAEIKRLGL